MKCKLNYNSGIKDKVMVLCLIIITINIRAQESKITIVTEEWAPYNYIEEGVLKGFSVEIVQEMITEMRANAEIKLYPSMRASYMLNNNPRTMLITMMKTPERVEKYNWIGPLGDDAIYFYKKKGNPLRITNLEDAKKVNSIATRHAGLVFEKLRNEGFENLDSSSTEGISIYKKLLTGRCDLGISESPLGVKFILKKLNYPADSLIQTSVKVVNEQLYIACSKDIPHNEITQWQQTLDKIKTSGIYDEIFKKYNE